MITEMLTKWDVSVLNYQVKLHRRPGKVWQNSVGTRTHPSFTPTGTGKRLEMLSDHLTALMLLEYRLYISTITLKEKLKRLQRHSLFQWTDPTYHNQQVTVPLMCCCSPLMGLHWAAALILLERQVPFWGKQVASSPCILIYLILQQAQKHYKEWKEGLLQSFCPQVGGWQHMPAVQEQRPYQTHWAALYPDSCYSSVDLIIFWCP